MAMKMFKFEVWDAKYRGWKIVRVEAVTRAAGQQILMGQYSRVRTARD